MSSPKTKRESLKAIQYELHPIYYRINDIERIIRGTELKLAAIDFEGAATDVWDSVFAEAEKEGRLKPFLDCILHQVEKEYPNRKEALHQAIDAYLKLEFARRQSDEFNKAGDAIIEFRSAAQADNLPDVGIRAAFFACREGDRPHEQAKLSELSGWKLFEECAWILIECASESNKQYWMFLMYCAELLKPDNRRNIEKWFADHCPNHRLIRKEYRDPANTFFPDDPVLQILVCPGVVEGKTQTGRIEAFLRFGKSRRLSISKDKFQIETNKCASEGLSPSLIACCEAARECIGERDEWRIELFLTTKNWYWPLERSPNKSNPKNSDLIWTLMHYQPRVRIFERHFPMDQYQQFDAAGESLDKSERSMLKSEWKRRWEKMDERDGESWDADDNWMDGGRLTHDGKYGPRWNSVLLATELPTNEADLHRIGKELLYQNCGVCLAAREGVERQVLIDQLELAQVQDFPDLIHSARSERHDSVWENVAFVYDDPNSKPPRKPYDSYDSEVTTSAVFSLE